MMELFVGWLAGLVSGGIVMRSWMKAYYGARARQSAQRPV